MELSTRGWTDIPTSPALSEWINHVRPQALAISKDPEAERQWLRHGRTWFAGVNMLPNDAEGRVGDGPSFPREVLDWIESLAPPAKGLDRAQISVCYPGYPGQEAESDAAFRYRRDRFASHLDGLLGEGAPKRRFFREYHAYILGLPLTEAGPDAAPLVVWEGSHRILADMLASELGPDPAKWSARDITEAYKEARTRIFETCNPRRISAKPGSGYLVHRFALHGVAPWTSGEGARAVLYFRPEPATLGPDFLTP